MSNRESGDSRRGRERDEESRRGSGREGYSGSQGQGSGAREGYSESRRGEYGRGNEELGPQGGTLYGQGRRSEEPWRPGQSGSSEGSSYGASDYGQGQSQYGQGRESQSRQSSYGQGGFGGSEYGESQYGGGSQGYGQGYGQDFGQTGGGSQFGERGESRSFGRSGYSGSRSMGPQSGSYGFGTEGSGSRQGQTGGYGFSYGSTGQGSTAQGSTAQGSTGQTGSLGRTPSRGRFSGRGPKGYSRSDDRIKEDVSDRLEQHDEIDATEITVMVAQGEVTLEGTVDDRWTKRMAEDIIEDLPGVKQVHNRLRIQQGNGGQQGQGQGAGSGRSEEGFSSKGGSPTKSSNR